MFTFNWIGQAEGEKTRVVDENGGPFAADYLRPNVTWCTSDRDGDAELQERIARRR